MACRKSYWVLNTEQKEILFRFSAFVFYGIGRNDRENAADVPDFSLEKNLDQERRERRSDNDGRDDKSDLPLWKVRAERCL